MASVIALLWDSASLPRANTCARERGPRMTSLDWLLMAFCLVATSLHVATTALAMRRCRQSQAPLPPPEGAPAVSILRPLRGVDSTDELTLRSGCAL